MENIELGNGINLTIDNLIKKLYTEDNAIDIKNKNIQYNFKNIILNIISRFELQNNDFTEDGIKKLQDKISSLVDDDILFGFAIFLSSNDNFDYNTSYLFHKIEEYKKFLFQLCLLIFHIVKDINLLKQKFIGFNNLVFIFQNFIYLKIMDYNSQILLPLSWDNFNVNIINDLSYYISIQYDNLLLLTFERKFYHAFPSDKCLVIEQMINSLNNQTN